MCFWDYKLCPKLAGGVHHVLLGLQVMSQACLVIFSQVQNC